MGSSPSALRLQPISFCSETSLAATRLGSYSRLASDGRTVSLRDHPVRAWPNTGTGSRRPSPAMSLASAAPSTSWRSCCCIPSTRAGGTPGSIALRSGQSRALAYIGRVWVSASAAVSSTTMLESRHHAYEVLAALRDRIETTPWRGERGRTALRVLRAHLNFAEIAGGPLHHASERQTAEEAGISRTTLRVVYETVLKPRGWLRRLRVGHGREGSTWYLAEGSPDRHSIPVSAISFPNHSVPPRPGT